MGNAVLPEKIIIATIIIIIIIFDDFFRQTIIENHTMGARVWEEMDYRFLVFFVSCPYMTTQKLFPPDFFQLFTFSKKNDNFRKKNDGF